MILFRPLQMSLKHRCAEYRSNYSSMARDGSLLILLLTFSSLIYLATRWVLLEVSRDTTLLLVPEIPLTFSFNIFLPMVFFASLAGVISHFFNSEDLELLLASPFPRFSFFIQRFFQVAIETSWMTTISLLPFLLSFTVIFYASPIYFLLLPFYLMLFILVPTAFAIIAGILWALIIPRIPALLIIIIFSLGSAYILHELISLMTWYLSDTGNINTGIILTGLGSLLDFGSSWSPGTWLAKGLAPFLLISQEPISSSEHSNQMTTLLASVLAGIAILTLSLSTGYLLFLGFYTKALSQIWGKEKKVFSFNNTSRYTTLPLVRLFPQYRQTFGLLKKEGLEFFRDPSQLVQAFFLLSILAMYLYILRFQENIYPLLNGLNPGMWEKILLLIHLVLECFITVAMTTRLLFPSISREGRTLWILQTSPLSLSKVLHAKFLFWCVPLSLLLATLSYISFYLQYKSTFISLIKVTLSISMVCSISGLASYLGSRFASFNWESRSQLVANFGSLVFMVSALLLASFTISMSVPIIHILANDPYQAKKALLLALVIVITNSFMTIYFLKIARNALSKMLRQER
jgi:ABC-2 type transport system permease protein